MWFRQRMGLGTGLALLIFLVAACNGAPKPTIIIGSKDFTEELLVGEMYAQMLEKAGLPVQRKLNLGDTKVSQAALARGDISLYPEYTGTGLLVVLQYKGETITDSAVVYERVKKEYAEKFKMTWLEQSPMNDTQALATTRAVAEKHNLKTLSDLALKAKNLRLASIAEFQDRPDGLPGLRQTYGDFDFQEVQIFDIGSKYKALIEGKADVAVAFSTDGAIAGNNLLVLEDDKNLWPPYHIAPVVRDDILAAHPQIKEQLNKLAPKLTNEVVSALNWEVDGKGRSYAEVAKEFLLAQKLIE